MLPTTDSPFFSPAQVTVLAVDDEPMQLELVRSALNPDYTLITAQSGEEAIALAKQHLPDIILLDLFMPGLDGTATCEQLKCDSQLRDIPVIFITSTNSESDENRCWQAGCSDFVAKPYNITTLTHRVHAHLTIKHQKEQLKSLAYRDSLTGLYNRWYLSNQLKMYNKNKQRTGNNFSVLLIDIDHFKAFNDQHGHLVGDVCLRYVGQLINQESKRPMDIVARYGGEEFVVVLPDTNHNGAQCLAERIRTSIEQHSRQDALNSTQSSIPQTITVSIGTSCSEGRDINHYQLILAEADKALYHAKEKGRNAVHSHNNE